MKVDKNKTIVAITAGIVSLLLVSSIFIQFKTVEKSQKADIESLRDDELKTQIATYKAKYEETLTKYDENQKKVQEYTNANKQTTQSSNLVDSELKQSQTLLGLTDVEGEGVIITLTDTSEGEYSSGDLRTLINELKYAGAEAISVNGNRLINLTDIVTLNDSFIVIYGGSVRITSPYVIKAIGDRTYLSSTLNLKNSGFVDSMKSNGLKIKVEQSSNIIIGKYTQTINAKYIKEDK